MGIPKFYRYISERWPLISQDINPNNQIPEFDNLYLDMNSILHTCTHSNDDTLTRMTEEQVYTSIFAYIDHLFQTIKPQKTFYMAIDGVAPRAKMNQQRSRRFRTAIGAEKSLEKAIKEGLEIPKEEPFDSNSITPGTEFMAKLTNNLKYFIHKKTSTDSNWQKIKIILSGHEVPGEGEHKIMEYIKTMKAQPDYNPNLRHCIYGLDADLIILGLVSHDPHFALLREEVIFGPRRNAKSADLESQKFNLLHLSLVREYLELEFRDLAEHLSFQYNFERILDDFILIMYVIGNDFLPNLPDLFINKGAFPLLIETFKQALKESDGYLNENGTINLQRLKTWLEHLSRFELENFEQHDVDVDWFNQQLENISIGGEKKRARQGKLLLMKQQKSIVGFVKSWLMKVLSQKIDVSNIQDEEIPSLVLPTEDVANNLEFIKKFAFDTGLIIIHSQSQNTYTAKLDIDGIMPNETGEEFQTRVHDVQRTIKKYQAAIIADDETLDLQKDLYNEKFVKWKDNYYKDKLGFSIHDEKEMSDLTQNYIEGLQWVLYYYYKGCPSWNWYYKYHYPPRISDVQKGLDMIIEFDKGKPFTPFQQLMAVLPARSRKLVPAIYRPLMTDPKSPIIDFYPDDVEMDLNGKTAEWEAVVKISFVDEKRLVEVMKPYDEKLTPVEKHRNSFGVSLTFNFNPQVNHIYPTPLAGVFEDLPNDHCVESVLIMPSMANLELISGLPKGAKVGTELLAGFPSLSTLSFDSKLVLNGTVVFQQPSRSESLILSIKSNFDDYSVENVAQRFVGQLVYTGWPYLREAKVVSIVDDMFKYEQIKIQNGKKVVSTPLDERERKDFQHTISSIANSYLKTKGVVLGKLEGLVYVKPVNGLIRTPQGAYVKTFSKTEEVYPIQLIVKEVVNVDERFQQKPPLPIEAEFPLESKVVFLGSFAYGAPAEVVGYVGPEKVSLKVHKLSDRAEPDIGHVRVNIEKRDFTYRSSRDVSRDLRLHPLFLSKITSSYMIENSKGRKVNIGLELKFDSRHQKVLGYTRKNDRIWEYSFPAFELISNYYKSFPQLFKNLQSFDRGNSIPTAKEVFKIADPEQLEQHLKKVTDWLKSVKQDFIKVSLESDALTRFSIFEVEKVITQYASINIPFSSKDIKAVPRNAILDPKASFQLLGSQRFDLGDRVVVVQDSGKVPYLSKGTVTGIFSSGLKVSLQIVFDHPFIGGSNLDGRLQSNRGIILDSSFFLNISKKQLIHHSKASKEKEVSKKHQHQSGKPSFKSNGNVNGYKPKASHVTAEDSKTIEKKKNELLSILHKDPSTENNSNGSSSGTDGNASEENSTQRPNGKAAKQVYGRVLGSYIGVAPEMVSNTVPLDHYPIKTDISTQPGLPVPSFTNIQATQELNSILHGVNGLSLNNSISGSEPSFQQSSSVSTNDVVEDATKQSTSRRGRGGRGNRGGQRGYRGGYRGGSRGGRGNSKGEATV